MKKFKNARELNEEKKRLKMRRAELEKAIKYDWRDVKDSLNPKNIAGRVFSGTANERSGESGTEAGILSEMAAKFASKLAGKAEDRLKDKIGKWFKK